MGLSITIVGLIIILIAWCLQIYESIGSFKISEKFIWLYLLGSIILTIDGFVDNKLGIGIFNAIIAIAAMVTWMTYKKIL